MSLRRLSGRISSGASAPKPATEPRSLIFEAFWGSCWLHFGTPRASKNKVFVWRVLHFSKNRGVRKIVEIGAISKHFGGHFGSILGPPGPQKTRFSCGECCIFRKIEGFEKIVEIGAILSNNPLIFKSPAAVGWEPGGGDLGEFTCGKRWGLAFASATTFDLQVASLTAPS